MNLARFGTKRVALILRRLDWRCVVRGTATYEQDPVLGGLLRITSSAGIPESTAEPEFILQEETWDGTIAPDEQFGCDYSIELFV